MSTNKRLERDIESTAASKLLVICVDRDDDVGRKAGIATPVVGRDSCINAAQRLALEDPEDADSNSIFYAVKTYEDLVSKGYNVEVAVVTGVEKRGVQADEKIVSEIRSILEKFSANGAVIVYVEIASTGNAVKFGDLTATGRHCAPFYAGLGTWDNNLLAGIANPRAGHSRLVSIHGHHLLLQPEDDGL